MSKHVVLACVVACFGLLYSTGAPAQSQGSEPVGKVLPARGPTSTFATLVGTRLGTATGAHVAWYPNDDASQKPLGAGSATLRRTNRASDSAEIEIPRSAGGPQGGVIRIYLTIPGESKPVFAGRFTVEATAANVAALRQRAGATRGIAPAAPAASAVLIEVNYAESMPSELICSAAAVVCDSHSAGLSSESALMPNLQLRFEIDDASQRAVDGSYDVSAALQGSLLAYFKDRLSTVAASAMTVRGTATARAGLITDLNVNLSFTIPPIEGTSLSYSLTGRQGGYRYAALTSYPDTGSVEVVYTSTYSISQPPALRPSVPRPRARRRSVDR